MDFGLALDALAGLDALAVSLMARQGGWDVGEWDLVRWDQEVGTAGQLVNGPMRASLVTGGLVS